MTDKQIKQNALAYRNHTKEYGETIVEASRRQIAFEEGAHSRDEEIESIYNNFKEEFNVLEKQLNQLRNPWVSVKDRLPEDKQKVIALFGKDIEIVWFRNGEFVCVVPTQTHIVGQKRVLTENGVHFEPMYGVPEREVITKVVTHWMPIPELKGGEI